MAWHKIERVASETQQPVSARITASGWISNGISFDDYARCQTVTRKTAGERRLPTPDWAMSNAMLRRVLVRFMEERAFSKKERARLEAEDAADERARARLCRVVDYLAAQRPANSEAVVAVDKIRAAIKSGLKERLLRACARIMQKRPAAIASLDKLCEEYVEIKQRGLNPQMTDKEWNESKAQPYMPWAEGEARYVDEQKRIKQLESEISGIDTYLRISENGGADVVAATVYLYYRTGLDSVGVGAELGLKPPHVRQTLFRLHQSAKRIDAEGGFGKLSKKKKKVKTPTGRGLVTPPLF